MIVDEKGQPAGDSGVVPKLSTEQEKEAEELTAITALVVHEVVRKDGEEELRRPVSALAWSGLAAGLSMGFSFLAEGLLRAYLPDAVWRPLLVNLGYPLGFLIVIIGRQQLFTENTLTAVIPLLAQRTLRTLVFGLRLWAVVLAANLVGAHVFAWALAKAPVVDPMFRQALTELSSSAIKVTFGTAIIRGIFAGWLIAMVVWMLAATQSDRVAIIVILTYVIGLGGLTHVVAGSVEVLYLVMAGAWPWTSYLWAYLLPTLIGNILGGVSLVSALNHAQVVAGAQRETPAPLKAG
jgi:formate/nitrite transporter FocA (FNT family)